MTTGWRMDAFSVRAARSYPAFDGSADINT